MACIGGTETYGRFVSDPFPALLERRLGGACVNFGSINSGLESILNDPELMRLACGAEACVVQLPGAQNLSNRLYRVHPRRNDRFLGASRMMQAIFDDVDFTQFHFTRHLLRSRFCRECLASRRRFRTADERETWDANPIRPSEGGNWLTFCEWLSDLYNVVNSAYTPPFCSEMVHI